MSDSDLRQLERRGEWERVLRAAARRFDWGTYRRALPFLPWLATREQGPVEDWMEHSVRRAWVTSFHDSFGRPWVIDPVRPAAHLVEPFDGGPSLDASPPLQGSDTRGRG